MGRRIQAQKSPQVGTCGGPTWHGNEVRHTFGDDGAMNAHTVRMSTRMVVGGGFEPPVLAVWLIVSDMNDRNLTLNFRRGRVSGQ